MTLELHVLEGEQRGARTALPAGRMVTVGGALDGDVVLRGAGLEGRRVALTALADGLRVEVLEGEIEAGGRVLVAGQKATLALDTPLALGSTRIGVVRPAAAAGEAEPDDAAAEAPAPADRGRARTWSRRLAGGGAALAAVSVAVLAFAYTATPAAPKPEQQARRAEALLRGAGLQRVAVLADAAGALRVEGYLENGAERQRAEQLLTAGGLDVSWKVFVTEQVAAAVQDVLRVNGVAAQVEALSAGAVKVRTTGADASALDGIRSVARRDVAGLAALEIVNQPAAAAGVTPVIEDPGKRVAAVVPGDPPYVVTADGTRYFEGALLPTGHRIAAIAEREVVLEINGVRTPLVF